MLTIHAEARYEDVPSPEILVVPGGIGSRALLRDDRVLDWVRGVHERSRWTTSVCTGSLVLAAAGLLDGLEATTHWMAVGRAGASSAPGRSPDRVVEQGKVITAAGVSSGIDMALTLAAREAGEEVAKAIQLRIEYDPQPPFDAGAADKVSREVLRRARGDEDAADALD